MARCPGLEPMAFMTVSVVSADESLTMTVLAIGVASSR
jgi:hypothetical protein